MANVGASGNTKYVETFMIPNLSTAIQGLDMGTRTNTTLGGTGGYAWTWIQNMDTSDTPYARAFSATKGMHFAGTITATDNNMLELCGDELMFYGQQGFSAVEVLFQVDNSSAVSFNFGFHDEVTESSNTLPVELSTATFYSSASTFLGFVYDADATNDELHCFWTDDDTDTTVALGDLRMKGMSLTADKWLWMRVEMQDRGSGNGVRATFQAAQDGKHVTKEFNTTVDRDQGLCWYLAVENRDALAHGVYVKGLAWEQSIAD